MRLFKLPLFLLLTLVAAVSMYLPASYALNQRDHPIARSFYTYVYDYRGNFQSYNSPEQFATISLTFWGVYGVAAYSGGAVL